MFPKKCRDQIPTQGTKKSPMGTIGSRNDARKVHRGEGGKRGTEAPPDPPILADAKGGRRTEGRERADDGIVLKKKKEATQGTKGKEKRADVGIVLKKKKGKKESIVKKDSG